MTGLKRAVHAIARSKTIAIAGHVNPDGDCIGSLLALGAALSGIGKQVSLVSQDGVPGNYRKLPGAGKVRKMPGSVPDMAITVDCNSKEMVGRPFGMLGKAKRILEIDHHAYRKPFGSLFLVDTNAAAVGEIVYLLCRAMHIGMTEEIAQNVLTSIIVETNSFRLPTVRPLTFTICAALLKTGVDFSRLSEAVYWSKTKAGAVLSGLCMARLSTAMNGRIAWSMVRKKDLVSSGGKDEDVDAVANDILSINTVKVAVFFREHSGGLLRVSLRSKGRIDVASLAVQYGGGGHFDSAGCYIKNRKSEITGFISAAKALLKQGPRP